MARAKQLLQHAARIYDSSPQLSDAAARAWRSGFSSGAEWMRLALSELRCGSPPAGHANFQYLGLTKYAMASAAGGMFLLAGMYWSAMVLLSVGAFYAIEVQWVFLFPAALDGNQSAWSFSRTLMRRNVGTLSAMTVVLPLALQMLTGGFRGDGWVRSWCLGCLAVLLWYEECRKSIPFTHDETSLPLLGLGNRGPLLIRKETINLPNATAWRLMLISDLHLTGRNCERAMNAIEAAIQEAIPSVIVLAGDLADTKKGLDALVTSITRSAAHVQIVALPGNHDHWMGVGLVQEALQSVGVHWLPHNDFQVVVDGIEVGTLGTSLPQTKGILPFILCGHDPAEVEHELCKARVTPDLVLAGHLHGSQVVFFRRSQDLYPGRWIYRWNVLRTTCHGVPLIVSRGVSDTIPVRWNCPREVVDCLIEPAL